MSLPRRAVPAPDRWNCGGLGSATRPAAARHRPGGPGPQGRGLGRAPGRDRGRHRAERRRQVDTAAPLQWPAPARGRGRAGPRAQHCRRSRRERSRPRWACCSSTPGTSFSNARSCGKSLSDSEQLPEKAGARTLARRRRSSRDGRRRAGAGRRRTLRADGTTRPNCPPPGSGCSPSPRSWPANRRCWRWTNRPSGWTGTASSAAGRRRAPPRRGAPPSSWSPTTSPTRGGPRTASWSSAAAGCGMMPAWPGMPSAPTPEPGRRRRRTARVC